MAHRLILARHASAVGNGRNAFVGSTDAPLDASGEAEAQTLAAALQGRRIDRLYTSPMRRCLDTAKAIARNRGLPAALREDLREIDFGEWENRSFGEIQKTHPEAVRRWTEDFRGFRFPAGESVAHFHERVERAAGNLIADDADIVLAVTHGGVIRAMMCHLLRIPPQARLAFRVKPACLATFDVYGDVGVLAALDNSTHDTGERAWPKSHS